MTQPHAEHAQMGCERSPRTERSERQRHAKPKHTPPAVVAPGDDPAIRDLKAERLRNLVADGGAKPETQIAVVVGNAVGNGFASSNESQIAGPPKLRGEVMREVRFNDECWILLTRLGMERLIVVGVNVDTPNDFNAVSRSRE